MSDGGQQGQTDEPDQWKETVRDIFYELHLGPDSVFSGVGQPLARRIVDMIEGRHHDYFCKGKARAERELADARRKELGHLT